MASPHDPMLRIGTGLFFALTALFLQSLTEWVFRHSPIYYTAHILLGVLVGLYGSQTVRRARSHCSNGRRMKRRRSMPKTRYLLLPPEVCALSSCFENLIPRSGAARKWPCNACLTV